MINRLIAWSLQNRFLVISGTLLIILWGVWALRETPIDAIPDLSENQVIVYADWPGRSPQEVEDQVTYPLSSNLQGLAGVRSVRANSMFGFSTVTVVFRDDIDSYFARARVLERLASLGSLLPEEIEPRLGPDATGLGWIYQYYFKVDPALVKSGDHDLGALRAVQDYFVRYQLNSVPGVAEVASIGGFIRQFEVEVSAEKLAAYGIPLGRVLDALADGNMNVGGRTIDENGMEFIVRGVGLVTDETQIRRLLVEERDGTPVRIEDLAEVRIGGDFRRGALDVNGTEVVGGIVVMRYGENAHRVIRDVKARIAELQSGLPPGVRIESFYDRSGLIDRAIETLSHALIEEIILVTLAHVIFLWHFRSILIVTIPLPTSILISFILLREFGVTSNIMSLTGIAISIGVLVDAAIVITENVIRRCAEAETKKGQALTPAETMQITLAASTQVGRPIFLSMGIIILAFAPVFALAGQEGKLFHPLAYAKTFAMIGAVCLSVTLVPVLCSLWVRGPFHSEQDNLLLRFLLHWYSKLLDFSLRHRGPVMAGVFLAFGVAALLALGLPRPVLSWMDARGWERASRSLSGLGSEFMPTLYEGSLLFMPVLVPSTSLAEVKKIMAWQDRVIAETPEVVTAAGKLGRAETATDPAPVEMIETTIELRPMKEWRPGLTREKLIEELMHKLSAVPGYAPGFLQPIEGRILMLSTGVRARIGVKIFGDDLNALEKKAVEIERLVQTLPGATGVAISRVQGKPYLEIRPKDDAMARHGLTRADLMQVVETGLGGSVATTSIRGRELWPVQVRLEKKERDDLERLGDVLVSTESGSAVRLGQIATINRVEGPGEIASENGRLRYFVQTNITGRDTGSFLAELQERLKNEIQFPQGMTWTISGEFENQLRATRTLRLMVPVVLLIIFLLLFVTFHSVVEAAHVLLAVPFALTGGLFLQWMLGYPFSVSVWVGYIALFGTAIQTGVIMVLYLDDAVEMKKRERGLDFSPADLLQAVKDGALLRLRPKVMTVSTVIASLLPIMWSTRAGVEVMKPLATPVIGGMVSSLIHILIVTPLIYYTLQYRREFSRKTPLNKGA